jgi:DNA-binding PadR family transcriptional regulator
MKASLGALEQMVLLALMRLGDDAYGVPIRDAIEQRTSRPVTPGAVYTALSRLEARGLVTSRFGEPTAERGGKRKRHYAIEPAGLELLQRCFRELRAMADGLEPRLEEG